MRDWLIECKISCNAKFLVIYQNWPKCPFYNSHFLRGSIYRILVWPFILPDIKAPVFANITVFLIFVYIFWKKCSVSIYSKSICYRILLKYWALSICFFHINIYNDCILAPLGLQVCLFVCFLMYFVIFFIQCCQNLLQNFPK